MTKNPELISTGRKLFADSLLEPENQVYFVTEIIQKIARLNPLQGPHRNLYLVWERSAYTGALNFPFEFSYDGRETTGVTFVEGPLDLPTVCALAYVLQEGLILEGYSTTGDKLASTLGVNLTAKYGQGIVEAVLQIGLAAKTFPDYSVEQVIDWGLGRARNLINTDIERYSTSLQQKLKDWGPKPTRYFPEKYDEQYKLEMCADNLAGIQTAQNLLAELRRFPWTNPNLLDR